MKKFNKKILLSIAILFTVGLFGSIIVFAAGPTKVDLGTAGNFAILSKAAITDVPTSDITGDVGASPITGASIGVTCAEVTGTIYSTNAAGPLPCSVVGPSLLTTAVSDMETAYTNASAPATPAAVGVDLNIGGGTLSGLNFTPGTYTWDTPGDVTITGDITLTGTAADVWIFQISGTLDLEVGQSIILAGGALPENIFWQVADVVTLKTGSHFEGTILAQTNIAMQNLATLNGRALAQTAVALDANTIVIPDDVTPITTATLNVIKTVINNDSGNKDASDFTINVTGTGVSDASFPGEEDPGTTITLDAGAYTIDEVSHSGYTKTLSADCSGTIAEGEDKTCTITNNDIRRSSGGGTVIGSMPSTSNTTTSVSSIAVTPTESVSVVTPVVIPTLPVTGFPPEGENTSWYKVMISSVINFFK